MRKQKVFPSYHLCETEAEAKRYSESRAQDYTPYMKRAYKMPHYLPHVIKNNDGKGNEWNGFIVWYYYHVG